MQYSRVIDPLSLVTNNSIPDKIDATHSYELKATNGRPWFSSAIVLASYLRLCHKVGRERVEREGRFKQVREMKAVALFLLGIMQSERREYWLQAVVGEATPDVRTMCFDKDENGVVEEVFQEVEVVTYDKHSNEDLVSFIKKTKIEFTRYPSTFIILCELRKNFRLPSPKQLFEQFSAINPEFTIALIGRTHRRDENYRSQIVYPRISHLEDFNAIEASMAYDLMIRAEGRHHTLTLTFQHNTKDLNIENKDEIHHPFEGLIPRELLL